METGYHGRLNVRDRAAYFQEYRKRRGESLRAYARDYARAHYVPTYRTLALTYNILYLRALRRGPEALATFKASWPLRKTRLRANWTGRIKAFEQQLQTTQALEIEKAMLDPELARLLAEQAKDANSFRIKYDLSFDENAPEWERGRRTVYSI
jgi:hypothetical protein